MVRPERGQTLIQLTHIFFIGELRRQYGFTISFLAATTMVPQNWPIFSYLQVGEGNIIDTSAVPRRGALCTEL